MCLLTMNEIPEVLFSLINVMCLVSVISKIDKL